MVKRIIAATLVSLALGTITLQVSATPIYGTVTMSHIGYGAKDTMTIWGGGHSGLSVYAGVYMFNKIAGTGEGQLLDNDRIGGFCMDLSEYLASGSKTYDVLMPQDSPRPTTFLGGPMGQQKAAYLAELWGRFFDPAWAAGDSFSSQQKSDAEAFAAAVWEIIYEDLPASSSGWDVTTDGTGGSRGFKATNLNYQTANSWLHALDGTGPVAQLRALSYSGYQDFIVVIPEPATVAFMMVGFATLILNRKIPLITYLGKTIMEKVFYLAAVFLFLKAQPCIPQIHQLRRCKLVNGIPVEAEYAFCIQEAFKGKRLFVFDNPRIGNLCKRFGKCNCLLHIADFINQLVFERFCCVIDTSVGKDPDLFDCQHIFS